MYTHEVLVSGSTLTKRYRSWSRGEHRREWLVLTHVHRHEPELVPRPVSARLDAVPPEITMSVVPGEPLRGRLTPAQIDALAGAIQRLWSVPHERVLEPRRPEDDLDFARQLTGGPRPVGGITAAAYDAASAWWDGPDPSVLRTEPLSAVLGHGDANLANYLWDGRRIRIVDFEDSAVSDPAMELANLVEHLSARHLEVEAVRARVEVDPVRLLAARRLWAMFWLRLLLPGGPGYHRNPPGTADAQARRLLSLLHDGER